MPAIESRKLTKVVVTSVSDEKEVRSVYFHEEQIEELNRKRKGHDVSFSQAVRFAINEVAKSDEGSLFAEERIQELKEQREELQDMVDQLDHTIGLLEDDMKSPQ